MQPRFSRDAIAEFEFIANRFDATQGRSQGIQINAVTKCGTNNYLGSFGGYFRDDSLNAADKIVNRVLPYSNQQLSTTHGGPIMRDKFHYFANYEFEREPWTTVFTTPYSDVQSRVHRAAKEHKSGLRLDYQFNPNLRATVRGAMWQNDQRLDQAFSGNSHQPSVVPGPDVSRQRPDPACADAGAGKQGRQRVQDRIRRDSGTASRPGYRGRTTPPPLTRRHHERLARSSRSTASGSGRREAFRRRSRKASWSFRNDFTISVQQGRTPRPEDRRRVHQELVVAHDLPRLHRHLRCAGRGAAGELRSELFPTWDNPDTWNLNALNPIIRRYTLGIGDFTFAVDRHVLAGWIQDDWQVTSNLTLNLGLRYDVALNGFGENYDFQPWVNGGRPNDTNNIQPRFGFAYQLNDRTVLRGGLGKYYARGHRSVGARHRVVAEHRRRGAA